MNFWWVNHKQTFRQEFGGGYVWCPKRKKDKRRPEGVRNHFYETMRVVRRGDLVLSYAGAAVQGYGLAETHCYSCPRPDDFGKVGKVWDKSGCPRGQVLHRNIFRKFSPGSLGFSEVIRDAGTMICRGGDSFGMGGRMPHERPGAGCAGYLVSPRDGACAACCETRQLL